MAHDDPHRITELDTLESLYGTVSTRSRDKVATQLNDTHRNFIAQAGFCIVASVGEHFLDCSPRGDAPGSAFAVLDPHRIALPDRRGNNRIDTLRHLLDDARVGLLFLCRGSDQALRVRGQAHITVEPTLLSTFELDGQAPRTVIVVQASEVLMQNTRAIRRSGLWRA